MPSDSSLLSFRTRCVSGVTHEHGICQINLQRLQTVPAILTAPLFSRKPACQIELHGSEHEMGSL